MDDSEYLLTAAQYQRLYNEAYERLHQVERLAELALTERADNPGRDAGRLSAAQRYNQLYCLAFARLDDISRQAQKAMQELEELQLAMAESPAPPGGQAR